MTVLLQHRCKSCNSVLFETEGPIAQTTKIRCRKCKEWNIFDKRLCVGVLVIGPQGEAGGIRRIVAVRETGYEWEYHDIPGKTFMSENSNDPMLVWWKECEPVTMANCVAYANTK